jgi:hypothetical protein
MGGWVAWIVVVGGELYLGRGRGVTGKGERAVKEEGEE